MDVLDIPLLPDDLERPTVSGSMAGHCRMAIWLAAQGREMEVPPENAQRTFDLGHGIEEDMFDGRIVIHNGQLYRRKPWWPHRIKEIVDYTTGETIITANVDIQNRQDEVEVDGFVGHVDAIAGPKEGQGEFFIPDCKTSPGRSWEKNIKSDLMENPFSRENVMQMQFYLEGMRLKRPALFDKSSRAPLIYYNKENSRVMARWVKYDEQLVKEVKERLSWARSGSEPMPDWAWQKGEPIPLRCGYCGMRDHCAEMRGTSLTLRTEKGQPKWFVA